jgi:cell division protein FtsW
MARRLKSDAVLFGTTLLLLVIGIAWVYSASVVKADASVAIQQGKFVLLGLAGLFVAMKVDYRRICNRPALLWVIGATAVLLIAVLLFGHQVKGARRWITIVGFRFQPSEFAKLAAVAFSATVLGRRLEEREPLEPGFFQAGLAVVLLAALVFLEPDYGGGLVLLGTGFVMMFVSGLPTKWVVGALLAAPPPLLAVLWLSPHSHQRLETWLDPYADPLGKGFQTIQSWIAVGTGGLWGKGFQASVQKMFYLPEAHNDYIFAVIAEEQGLIGATVVLACFAVIIWRGLIAARRAPDAFGSLLAAGLTVMLGLPALINMGVVTNLLPAKGISLPLVSAGGSSMIVSLVAIGLLLNVSQQASATGEE